MSNSAYSSKAFDTSNQGIIDKVIWLLTTILLASFIIFDTNVWISYILLCISILIFMLTLVKQKGRFILKFSSYHKHVFTFSIFCLFSAIWAWQSSYAIEKGITVFEILVCMSILYIYYQMQPSVWSLLNAIKWAGYTTTIYTFMYYGVGGIRSVLAAGERLGEGFANINSIAMFSSLSITITVFELLFKKFSPSILLVIPGIVIVAASGSRKALVMAVIGVILIVIQKYATKNILKTILRIIVIAVFLSLGIYFLSQLSVFSGINERMEGLIALIIGKGNVDSSALKRADYITLTIAQFKQAPILGIGMDNARLVISAKYGFATYSHNNFAELLCNGGIIGFAIYYSMHFHCIISLFRGRKKDNPMTVVCLVLSIILLLMDWGVVSYYSKSTYFYYMIFYLQVANIRRSNIHEISKVS